MRHGILVFCAALTACAHFDPAALERWATEKAQVVAECAAQSLAGARDLDRCLGEFAADLGTPACGEAAELRAAVMTQGLERAR